LRAGSQLRSRSPKFFLISLFPVQRQALLH
jgi:hypothetical protein